MADKIDRAKVNAARLKAMEDANAARAELEWLFSENAADAVWRDRIYKACQRVVLTTEREKFISMWEGK